MPRVHERLMKVRGCILRVKGGRISRFEKERRAQTNWGAFRGERAIYPLPRFVLNCGCGVRGGHMRKTSDDCEGRGEGKLAFWPIRTPTKTNPSGAISGQSVVFLPLKLHCMPIDRLPNADWLKLQNVVGQRSCRHSNRRGGLNLNCVRGSCLFSPKPQAAAVLVVV